MKPSIRILLPALLLILTAGCAQYENRRGVEATWTYAVADMKPGQTTRSEVLALLGPPSQLIALEGETVLYYLFERSDGEALILVFYNRMQIDTRYDRAIFFFDENDVLTDLASHVAVPASA